MSWPFKERRPVRPKPVPHRRPRLNEELLARLRAVDDLFWVILSKKKHPQLGFKQ
jgi:hypothetical protein